MHPYKMRKVVHLLGNGGIIAYPTEGVFGLGCDPCNQNAVNRLLAIKKRPQSKGLIVIAATLEQLHSLIEPLSESARARLEATWPGPVTWVLPAQDAPAWLRGDHNTLAVRITAHPLAAALCRAWGGPLVSTSANISTRLPARTALAVRRQLGQQVDAIVSGQTQGAKGPTEIRDLTTEQVIRAG
jgi:L-threonylcarbamoyladenylate synthase